MDRLLALIFLTVFSFSVVGNTPNNSLEDYIETWKDVAINQMHTHGIPASITLSQGILESGFGNSKLAIQANNHFGIKCHDWNGETFLKDDDKRNECFRKYNDAAQSFEDHSNFLTSRSRYSELFELKPTDYKGWAKGLKTAGYATNPTYDKKLIDLIHRYDLDQYDKAPFVDLIVENKIENKVQKNTVKETQKENVQQSNAKTRTPLFAKFKNDLKSSKTSAAEKRAQQRQVYTNPNKTKYVVAGKHDTFYQIAKEFGVSIHQLHRWNDFPPTKDVLQEGDKVYIMRKRKSLGSNVAQLQAKQPQELWKISQEYGIQLKSLAEFNNITSPEIAMTKEK